MFGVVALLAFVGYLNGFLARHPEEIDRAGLAIDALGVGATIFLGAAALWLAGAGNRNAAEMHRESVARAEREKRLSLATDLATWGTNAVLAIDGGTRKFIDIETDPRGFELESRVLDLGDDNATPVFMWMRLLQHNLERQLKVLSVRADQERLVWTTRGNIFRLVEAWREDPTQTRERFLQDIAQWNDPSQ